MLRKRLGDNFVKDYYAKNAMRYFLFILIIFNFNVILPISSVTGQLNFDSKLRQEDSKISTVADNGSSESPRDITTSTSKTDQVDTLTSLMYLTKVNFTLTGEINETSPLFGRINDKKITVAVYTNDFNDSYTAHLGTLYTTSFLRDKSTKILSGNDNQAMTIIHGLEYISWPYNKNEPEARKIFVEDQIMKMGFVADNSSESNYYIGEFVKGFDLDDSLRHNSCLGCFCSIYKHNQSQEMRSTEEILICFSTEFTEKHLRILYPMPPKHSNGIIWDENNKRVGCRKDVTNLNYAWSSDGLLRPVGNLTSQFDLKTTTFNSKDGIIKSSPLYGRINVKNISVGLFSNETGFDCKMHLGTLYATSFLRNNTKHQLSGHNNHAMKLFSGLTGILWPFNSDDPGVRRRFVENKIIQMGYTADNSNESKYYIKEFVTSFEFDQSLEDKTCRFACFCNIYHQNQSQETESYEESLICFTPVLTTKQISILYAEHLAEQSYTNASCYAMILSTIFILITLTIYIRLPELRKSAYGQCICFYLLSMFVSFTCMYVITLFAEYLRQFCFPMGYAAQFSWLTNFTWQTILCFEILMAFWKGNSLKMEQWKKLGLYCSYAYGLPALITLITASLQFGPFLDDSNPWKPNMNKYCFFPKLGHKNVRWLYFSGPYGAMILMNFLMFIMTVILLVRNWSKQRASSRKSKAAKQDKNMIRAHITLFFVMGTNWIFELIIMIKMNTIPPNSLFWQIFDSINNLIGIFLFLVLICNSKVLKILRKQCGIYSKNIKSQDSEDRTQSYSSVGTRISTFNNKHFNCQEDLSSKL